MENLDFFGEYHLQRLDDKLCKVKATLSLAENDGVDVVAKVASTLRGSMKMEDGKLVGRLESSAMVGLEEEIMSENEEIILDEQEIVLEEILKSGFDAGFAVHWTSETLTLVGEQHTLVFERDISVMRIVGGYTLIEFNGEPVSSDSAKLVIVSGVERHLSVFARFGNSLRGELTLEDNTLRGTLASTMDDVDDVVKETEDRFSLGMESGMRVSVNGKRLVLQNESNVFVYIHTLIPEDIVGEYMLESFNGVPVQSDDQISLVLTKDTSESQVDVLAKVSNMIRGKAKLQDDKLCGRMISTRMMGGEEEMLVEDALTGGFEAGFLCSVDSGVLTLCYNDNTLVYTRAADMPYENGRPTYFAKEVTPCFKGRGNGLLFRINNKTEGKWAFYNDTRKYNMRVTATFGTRSRIKSLGNAQSKVNNNGQQVVELTVAPTATEMFIAGHVNGYNVSYDALPV